MKEKARLEHMVDEATQEDSKHSLHFGQILMSVENLYLRCTAKRRNIQHSITPADDDGSKKDACELRCCRHLSQVERCWSQPSKLVGLWCV
eukprot:6462065-Amphidinium_carterae.1